MTTPEMIDAAEANIRADHRAGKISKEQFQKEMLIMARARHQAQTPSPQTNLRVALEKAAEALRPMADAVFNDNGDMTVNMTMPTGEECIQAYFAEKRIQAALAATATEDGKP